MWTTDRHTLEIDCYQPPNDAAASNTPCCVFVADAFLLLPPPFRLAGGAPFHPLPYRRSLWQTYDYCKSFLANAADKFTGDEYITFDKDAKYPYGFLQVQYGPSAFFFFLFEGVERGQSRFDARQQRLSRSKKYDQYVQ